MPADDTFEMPPDPEHDKWLAELIADPNAWGKEPDEDEQANVVVPLQAPRRDEQPPTPRSTFMQPTWGAMAASIAVLLALGGGAYLYDSESDNRREEQIAALDTEVQQLTEERAAQAAESDRLTRQVTALGIQLSEATAARDDATNQLAEAKTAIEGLNAAQEDLSAQLAAANDEVVAAQAARDNLEQQIASLDAETRQAIEARVAERDELTRQLTALENRLDDATAARDNVTNQLAEAQAEIDAVNADRAELVAQLADATEDVTTAQAARDKLDAELADARTAIDTLDAEKKEAASQVAELDSQMTALQDELVAAAVAQVTLQAQLDAEIGEGGERLAALENALDEARADITGLNQSNDLLLSERDQLLQQGTAFQTALNTLRAQTGWLAQVAGYHIGYAGTPREVEVKVDKGFEETTEEAVVEAAQELSQWLSGQLGQQISIPLNPPFDGGLDFIGGRVLPTIDGIPVGQIAYHDSQGRLTAFCLKPNPTGEVQGLQRRQFFDRLQMIQWQDEDFQYVVVGFADYEALEPMAAWLQENYGEDT